jgi:hypothetical protein
VAAVGKDLGRVNLLIRIRFRRSLSSTPISTTPP